MSSGLSSDRVRKRLASKVRNAKQIKKLYPDADVGFCHDGAHYFVDEVYEGWALK